MTQTAAPSVLVITDVLAAAKMVTEIKNLAEGGEIIMASRMERNLHIAALEGIAGSNAQAGWIAAAALESLKIEFTRCFGDMAIQ